MSKKLLSSLAYKAIKERIASMPSGSYLSARQCALELGISYTPVREAFLQLQKEGVLRQVPNVGFFIQNIDLTDLFQIFQVRECVELFALEKAFDKLSGPHIADMKKTCAQAADALRENDSYRYSKYDAEFHRIPLEILGNKPLLSLYDDIRAKYLIVSGQMLPLIDDMIQDEHLALIDAVEQRDEQRAKELLLRHIQEMKQRIINNYIRDQLR